MDMRRPLRAVVAAMLLGAGASAAGQEAPGTADHAMVARFKGSTIRAQMRKEFDRYVLPLGPADTSETKFQKQQEVEGKVLKTLYDAPAGSSPLAVYRSYQTALQQAGFDTLFTCAAKQCSPNGRLQYAVKATRPADYIRDLGGRSFDDDAAYLLVTHQAKNDLYAVVYATHIWNDPAHVVYMVDIVETKPLEAGLVTVDAKVMATDIGTLGHVALYGIYFDTGQAVVKASSDATLAEIAKLLAANAQLKLLVVGHTDNVGTLAANMTLSKQRADAVVAALTSRYQVAATRLQAGGAGPLAPVASNRTDAGRAKNRRVELVEQ